jgi:hypothetical protein
MGRSKKRVPIHGKPQGYVAVEDGATEGSTIGTDLRWPDGSVVTEAELRKAVTAGAEAAAKPVPSPANPPASSAGSYSDAQADARVAAGLAGAFVPTLLATGQTFSIPANRQALFALPIELEGTASLDISGALVEVA